MNCKNCDLQVSGNFCANCGQKAIVGPISLPRLMHDLPHAVFHVDKGLLFNLLQFFKRPGPAIEDYIEGKRKPYFHPASYLVVSLILNYLVVKITDMHFFDNAELLTMDPVKAKAITDYDALQWWFLEHTYLYILIAIPASTIFLHLVFKSVKHRFNLAENAVVILFTIAQGVFIQCAFYAAFGWVNSGPFIRTIEMINVCCLISYATYVCYQLLTNVKTRMVRSLIAFVAGFGLASIWVASGYLLYFLSGH